jgi:carbon storage regulator
MLVLSRKIDEKIVIGDEVVVRVIEIRGDKVRLGIEAPPDVEIDREEVRASKDAERRRRQGGAR